MKHELIDVAQWPSMPAPMSSTDQGEAWVWGDFFATLQKQPIDVAQALREMTGNKASIPAAMDYPFAMSVFYNLEKNPHGPSRQPILCVGLERANCGAIEALGEALGIKPEAIKGLGKDAKEKVFIGVFTGSGRANLGRYNGPLNANAARKCFFDVIRSQLGLAGNPVLIGSIEDVYGHPNTGWPAMQNHPDSSRKSGCLGTVLSLALVLISIIAVALKYLPNHVP